jgi:hypothetical protein
MPKNKLPPDVVKHWPEIFGEVEIKAVPIEYIHSVNVYFHDGKIWEINMDKQSEVSNLDLIETSLEAFLSEYNDEISHVDFRLNTSKVVQDVKSRTRSFMKKRK